MIFLAHMSNSYSIFCQQGSYFFNLRFELGAVSALNEKESTQEAENMTSQNLGSE